MDLVRIYQCLCDTTRLRILNLLQQGPLCVCHIQVILGEPQVKISKHLGYLKSRGLVSAEQKANWRIYGLVEKPSKALESNLACLHDCASEHTIFRRDLEKLNNVRRTFGKDAPVCCSKPPTRKLKSSRV
jgi:ArsR family transcriptional regulator, arsenate/arsenite/antimonite-responsive transcriptional repressor